MQIVPINGVDLTLMFEIKDGTLGRCMYNNMSKIVIWLEIIIGACPLYFELGISYFL